MQNPFVYDANEPVYVTAEKQIRCVAFLLNACTQLGNRELEGNIACGLSEILSSSADRLAASAVRKLQTA